MKINLKKKQVTLKKKAPQMPFKPKMGAKLAAAMSKNMSV